MRSFTQRIQNVRVFTLSSLRTYLKNLQPGEASFSLDKLHHDHVVIRAKDAMSGKKSRLVLPTYPTGHPDDDRWNPNVVLDPIGFIDANTPEERSIFAPVLGSEILHFYEKLHQNSETSLLRCC
jgi:hypothetical protein